MKSCLAGSVKKSHSPEVSSLPLSGLWFVKDDGLGKEIIHFFKEFQGNSAHGPALRVGGPLRRTDGLKGVGSRDTRTNPFFMEYLLKFTTFRGREGRGAETVTRGLDLARRAENRGNLGKAIP